MDQSRTAAEFLAQHVDRFLVSNSLAAQPGHEAVEGILGAVVFVCHFQFTGIDRRAVSLPALGKIV